MLHDKYMGNDGWGIREQGGTIENSKDFVCKFQGNGNGSGLCYLKFLEYKLQLIFLRHYCWCVKVGIDPMGDAGLAMYSLFLLTGLYRAQGSQVIPTLVLFADLEPLAEKMVGYLLVILGSGCSVSYLFPQSWMSSLDYSIFVIAHRRSSAEAFLQEF